MQTQNRLLGVDIFRGLAAYGVVLLHSGDSSWGNIDESVLYLRNFFGFPVPFFLATSFYFMARTFAKCGWQNAPHLRILKSKASRLIVPYIVWTIIYSIVRNIYLVVDNSHAEGQKMLDDTFSVIFFGGASYHLYFLPLLFTGIVTFVFLNTWFDWVHINKIIILLIVSLIVYEFIDISGNSFELGDNIAFQQLLYPYLENTNFSFVWRWISVELSWSLRCMPYIFFALLMQQAYSKSNKNLKYKLYEKLDLFIALMLILFVISTFLIKPIWSGTTNNLIVAYSLLIIALLWSKKLSGKLVEKIASSLGKCSLGIYLIHAMVIPMLKIIITKVFPGFMAEVSISSVIMLSIPSFLISWLMVALLIKHQLVARYLFAMK